VLAAALGLAALAPRPGDAAPRQARELGHSQRTPNPTCVPKPGRCFGYGRVTGFMTKIEGRKNPFVAPSDGRIVAWSVKLGGPPSRKGNPSDLEFFQDLFGNERFGKGPGARISILKRVERGKDKGKYRLVRQSPYVKLNGYFGRRVYVTLETPLRIRKGMIVALTTDTWLVNLVSANQARNSAWRASRTDCSPKGARTSRPQRKVGTKRRYGCTFGDRLMYWAYFVPDRSGS